MTGRAGQKAGRLEHIQDAVRHDGAGQQLADVAFHARSPTASSGRVLDEVSPDGGDQRDLLAARHNALITGAQRVGCLKLGRDLEEFVSTTDLTGILDRVM